VERLLVGFGHAQLPERLPEMSAPRASSAVAVLRAAFADPSAGARAERELASLCADGQVDLLDGVLVDWPATAAQPRWRALRNVPRIGALPDPSWASYVRPVGREGGAIVALVSVAQQTMLVEQLTSWGALVGATILSATEYEELRHPPYA
jgi:hypothetical protein